MLVGEAQPGQVLVARGRVVRTYTRNLPPEEVEACRNAGFITGFLMPAWIGDHPPHNAWPKKKDHDRLTPLFYVGPLRLRELVGGLKKYHIFLYEGQRVGLEGYDFRHLESIESL